MSTQELIKRIHHLLRSNQHIVSVYHKIRDSIAEVPSYDIAEVTPLNARKDSCDDGKLRLNLVVPSVDQKHVFGGIATAIRFFEELVAALSCEARVLTVDAPVIPESSTLPARYQVVTSDQDSAAACQVVGYADRYMKSFPVRQRDLFIATGWWTAYTLKHVLKWQSEAFQQPLIPMIYLIQDYEPGFYAWSSRYLMADSTYQMDVPVYAVFNSKQLKEFFDCKGYAFAKSWYFDPVLNPKLKEYLPAEHALIKKKKQIIVYGRPQTARNAFEVIVSALRIWAEQQPNVREWEIYSAGEEHADIELGNGQVLRSVGKLTLEQYAQFMLETYAGISLMVSPHPSYPPLEMATFGIKTITNCYDNKNLASFSNNIISLSQCPPEIVARTLIDVCIAYQQQVRMNYNSDYANQTNEFGSTIGEVATLIK